MPKGKLAAELEKFANEEATFGSLQHKLTRAENARIRLSAENRSLIDELSKLQERVDLLERLDALTESPPAWTVKTPRKGSLHHSIPTLMLSDCHFDEVVRPEEVEGVNCYNRKIAVQRLHRVYDGIMKLLRSYYQGLHYDGMVIMLGGDMLSGSIHEELLETNDDTVYGSVDFWSEQVAGFIKGMQEEFKNLHVYGVVGNHGRRTRKPRSKLRVRDNLDWLMYRMIRNACPNVTFTIPESADIDVPIYNTQFRLTHGDQFRGGSGISGSMAPILLGHHRKAKRQMHLKKPFEWLVVGHWHDYFHGRGIIMNGSLKGYDEYAYTSNFDYQRPIQALWITTPENGPAFPMEVYADNRKTEGW